MMTKDKLRQLSGDERLGQMRESEYLGAEDIDDGTEPILTIAGLWYGSVTLQRGKENRQKALMLNGCNYISPGTKRSAPFAIFNRQDLLRLNRILDAPVPEVYGEIVGEDVDGVHYTAAYIREIAATEPDRLDSITLRTTLAQRTGCSMCGFGITLEKRPHRFDLLREQNPQEWEFWMKHVLQDENGEWYGWGRVLDYIGVGWEDIPTSRK